MFKKCWYFFCLIFLIFNLHLLWLDGFEVNHRNMIVTKLQDLFRFSVCVPIDGLILNFSNLKDHSLDKCFVNSSDLINLVMDRIIQNFKEKFKNENETLYFERKNVFLFKKNICFMIDKNRFKVVYVFRNLKYRILLVSRVSKSFFFNSITLNENENSFLVDVKIFKLNINNERNPFSDCQHDRIGNKTYSKFNCLNQCLKLDDTKYPYFYSIDYEEFINLNDTSRNRTKENVCYKKCRKENCVLEYNLAVSLNTIYKKEMLNSSSYLIPISNPTIDEEYLYFEIFPALTLVDFWLQVSFLYI